MKKRPATPRIKTVANVARKNLSIFLFLMSLFGLVKIGGGTAVLNEATRLVHLSSLARFTTIQIAPSSAWLG
jgi:hypothetical protein